jgi:hypothetical protein
VSIAVQESARFENVLHAPAAAVAALAGRAFSVVVDAGEEARLIGLAAPTQPTVRQAGGDAWIVPGLDETLATQPYHALRQETGRA